MTNPAKYLVIYHGNCWDGAAAAYCMMCHLQKAMPVNWEDIIVQPWVYGDKRDVVEYVQGLGPGDLRIYIVDFSFNRTTLTSLCDCTNVASVSVIDHHKTAQADLENWKGAPVNFYCIFDMARSGARLCFNLCCAQLGPAVEQLVNYIQDRDLWEWKLAGTTAVMAWMDTMDRTPANFAVAVKHNGPRDGLEVIKTKGLAILEYQHRVITEHVSRAALVIRDGYTFATVNATTLPSEIGQALLEKFPAADVAHMYNDRYDLSKRIHSLRSRKATEGGVDVSAIAKKHGGGGHYSAAGYETELCP